MRILLNTLYVTTPESYISKDGENIVISVDQTERFRIPAINVEGIVTFGYMGASPGVMKLCADHGISLCFLSPKGRFIGRFQGPIQGNVLLRQAQFHLTEDSEQRIHLDRIFIGAKIQNYYAIVARAIRDYGNNEMLENAASRLRQYKDKALKAESEEILLGIEGLAANTYFSIFGYMIRQQHDEFPFNGRNRRPPKDAVNALLSFVYTLICNDVVAALETVGLDSYLGFFHKLRPGRPSLALDLMEELRAYLGDRLVLSLINRRQVSPSGFVKQGEEGILMTDDCRNVVIKAYQNRKQEIITHPFLNEKLKIGLIPYVQAMLLARYIRKDLDDYPVFIIK